MRRTLLLTIVCLLSESVRADLLVPYTQARNTRVSTMVGGVQSHDSETSLNFGPFLSSVTLQPSPTIGATATQNTSISSSGIEGSCFAQSQCAGPMNGNDARGESDLIVRFTITETVTYTMQGTFVSSGLNALLASPMIHLSMNDTNGPTVELVQAMSGTTPFLRTGQLLPGVYALRAYAFSGSIGGNFTGHSVDLDFNFAVTPSAGVLPVFLMAAIGQRRRRREQVGRVSRRVG